MAERRRLPVIQSAPPAPPVPPGPPSPSREGAEPEDDNATPVRPPWHWVGFGTVAIFAVWLPLAYVAQAAVARVLAQRFGAWATAVDISMALGTMPAGERARLMAMLALPNAVALGLSAFVGGYLVGRFGAGTTGRREAALAGATTAIVALVLALGAGTASGITALVTAVVVILLCVGSAAWGGKVGFRKRSPAA